MWTVQSNMDYMIEILQKGVWTLRDCFPLLSTYVVGGVLSTMNLITNIKRYYVFLILD